MGIDNWPDHNHQSTAQSIRVYFYTFELQLMLKLLIKQAHLIPDTIRVLLKGPSFN